MEGKNKVESLLSNVEQYAETRFDLALLSMQEKMGNVISSAVSAVLLSVFGLFVLLFASIGGAWWLGEYVQSPSIGFFAVAGLYLLIAFIIYLNRDRWIRV